MRLKINPLLVRLSAHFVPAQVEKTPRNQRILQEIKEIVLWGADCLAVDAVTQRTVVGLRSEPTVDAMAIADQ